MFWVWLHTLTFDLHNQSSSEALLEDTMNKSDRPIPSGRTSIGQTKTLLAAIIPIVFTTALFLGGVPETVFLLIGNFMYNDGRGSDNCVLRNLSIAIAYGLYSSGALEVACAGFYSHQGLQWNAMMAFIVFTTMQVQDLKDQRGDSFRDRKTIPLVSGDTFSRWSIYVPTLAWSIIIPRYWSLPALASIPSLLLGGATCARPIGLRSSDADRTSWKLWSIWVISLYLLPVIKRWVT